MKAKQVRNDKLNKLSLGDVQTIPVTVKQARKTQFGSLLQEAKFEDKKSSSDYFHFVENKRNESLL